MDILVVGDCHGEKPEIPEKDYDLVLATGDICGGTDEMRQMMFDSTEEDKEWYEKMGEKDAREEVRRSLEEGREILEQLEDLDAPVFLVSGNWDWNSENSDWDFLQDDPFQEMVEEFENVKLLDFKSVQVDGLNLVGYGPVSAPEVPQYEDDEPEDEEELEDMKQGYRETLEELEELVRDSEKPTMLLSHNVPHDTELDMIDNEDSPVHGRHYGSLAVRELLSQESVFLNVAGHIHEGEGMQKVEGVTCINAGINQLVEIEVEKGKVEGVEFI